MCDAPLRTPPGWTAYMDALRSLGERGHLGSIASAELVRAGKALAVTAFEVGADAMAAAAGEREPVPSPMQLRAMARPNTPTPCRPGGHCERWARKMGGCIAGECHRPPEPAVPHGARVVVPYFHGPDYGPGRRGFGERELTTREAAALGEEGAST